MINKHLDKSRQDIDLAIEIWKEVLLEFFSGDLLVVYVKGSAIKQWDSIYDYVPLISDLDIHIQLQNQVKHKLSTDIAMEIAARYENRFKQISHDYLHIPRTQVIFVNELKLQVNYIPPKFTDIQILIDNGVDMDVFLSDDSVDYKKMQRIDRENLESYEDYLKVLAKSLIDRTGLDYWLTIRRMCWRVSPAPIRVLSQLNPEIYYWSMNRTKVIQHLKESGLHMCTRITIWLDGTSSYPIFQAVIDTEK
ncbi:MAG: hypothetical protein ACXAB7_01850 [Candidatus Kariarchaeaceae archaeon]